MEDIPLWPGMLLRQLSVYDNILLTFDNNEDRLDLHMET